MCFLNLVLRDQRKVVEVGRPGGKKQWFSEESNFYDDYRAIFGASKMSNNVVAAGGLGLNNPATISKMTIKIRLSIASSGNGRDRA